MAVWSKYQVDGGTEAPDWTAKKVITAVNCVCVAEREFLELKIVYFFFPTVFDSSLYFSAPPVVTLVTNGRSLRMIL